MTHATTAYRDAFDLGTKAQLVRCLSILDAKIVYWVKTATTAAEQRNYQLEANALMRRDLLIEVAENMAGTPFGPEVIVPDYLK